MNCCRALIVNLQKVFYNSQASVGDRHYTIILFISIIFFPTIRNYVNDREVAPLSFGRILAPPPPRFQKLYYLNDRDEGRYYFCRILAPPLTPQYLTILMTERGRALSFVGFWRLPMPPPPMTPQYLTILMTGRRGAIIFCRTLAPLNAPPPRRHNT